MSVAGIGGHSTDDLADDVTAEAVLAVPWHI